MNELAIFVKPWKALDLPALATHIKRLGFDLIELPVRPEFPCQPETIETDLPAAVKLLANEGVRVLNATIAMPLADERWYAACAEAGIGMNRVMFRRGDMTYWDAEADARRQLDAAIPLCEQYDMQIGIQNHNGNFVGVNAMGLYHLVKDYDPRYVGAIWDPAHQALEGMAPEPALDVIASHLCVVNLKNAYWQRISGPEADIADWQVYWTSGQQGRANWKRVIDKIKAIGYQGAICFSAEYTNEEAVDTLIVKDLAFAKELLN